MEHVNTAKAAIASAVAVLTALWGWFGWLVLMLVCCMGGDYITGSAAALHRGEWSSRKVRDGIWHKAGCILVVIVAGMADLLIGTIIENMPGITLPFSYSVLICPIIVVWYILTELGSIIENAVSLGAPCPPWLAPLLAATKNAIETANENQTPKEEKQ